MQSNYLIFKVTIKGKVTSWSSAWEGEKREIKIREVATESYRDREKRERQTDRERGRRERERERY